MTNIVPLIISGVSLFFCGIYSCILLAQEIKTLKKKNTNNMIQKYRILERKWSNDKEDYVVQEYIKKWYSRKYKWKTVRRICSSVSWTWTEDAVFYTKEEAEKYIKEETNCVISSKVVKEYSCVKRIKLWIARDKNEILHLHFYPPERVAEHFVSIAYNQYQPKSKLPNWMFPEITWDNSPQEAEIILI